VVENQRLSALETAQKSGMTRRDVAFLHRKVAQ
jgi:hypothetical protein